MSAGPRAAIPEALREHAIGVFDSGIGGLTVLRALLEDLPQERFIYLGDTARLPYGTKSAATVTRYSVQAAGALVALGVKCLVVACNTASSAGLESIREHAGALPVIGVIEPGADAACAASATGRIAVIATEGTVRAGAYQQAILARRPDAHVHAIAAPLFVALAEEGLTDGSLAQGAARHYLGALFDGPAAPDTLVLGCTHFPVLATSIRAIVGPSVRIVDSARTTAREVRRALCAARIEAIGAADYAESGGSPTPRGAAGVRLLATDGAERFARVGGRFLGREIEAGSVELIDL